MVPIKEDRMGMGMKIKMELGMGTKMKKITEIKTGMKTSKRMHKQPAFTDRAWIELDQNSLRQNVIALKKLIPQDCSLMPVLKANAYGHGAVHVSSELNRLGIRSFCVSTISEGIELRLNGIKGEILILGYTHPEQFPLLRKYNLTQSVIDHTYAHLLNSCGKKLKVHLKIDTGMHRFGECSENIDKIYEIFNCRNLIIKGIYTHLCCVETITDSDIKYTMSQSDAFNNVITQLNKRGYAYGKIHLLASYGLYHYPELARDYVRIGAALYGVLITRTDFNNYPIKLYPVLSIKTRVALIRDMHAGEAAGYGLQYAAESNRKIAVLTIGYADGIPRALSCGRGKVLINGHEALIVGRICMNQMLVDITDISDVKCGDTAVIVGKSGEREITAYDIAEAGGVSTYELLCHLGTGLNRLHV